MEKVYAEKLEFVEALDQAVAKIPYVEAVEYKHIPGRGSEFVKFTWDSGDYMYIDVTCDSLSAILSEISAAISGGSPVGRIRSMRHSSLIDEWWEEAE